MLVALGPTRRLLLFVMTLGAAVAAPAAAQIIDVPPFKVLNTQDASFGTCTVAPGSDASVLVVTTRKERSGKRHAVSQLVAPFGGPSGIPLEIDDAREPSGSLVAADTRGGYIALWRRSFGGQVVARLLDATGTPRSPIFDVSTDLGFQIAAAGYASGLAVVWTEREELRLQRFDPNGQATGAPALVAAIPPSAVFVVAVAPTSGGGFFIAWDESGRVRGRSYDASGAPLGEATVLTDVFALAALAPNPLGGFAIVGHRETDSHRYPSGVWGRRFDETATPTGPVFLVDPVEVTLTAFPHAAFDPAGRLYVVWGLDSFVLAPRGRAFDPSGHPLHASFALTPSENTGLTLTARPDGRFTEAWRSTGDLEMLVRSLCVPPAYDGCGDGVLHGACERCDAGPGNSDTIPDTCRTTCAVPSCADGVVDFNETCDDGNNVGCDGCDAKCNTEVGWICGDGAPSPDCDEECDAGPGNDDTLPNACRTDCRRAHCGDGVVDDGEGCDDGNRTSCDGCSDLCVPEPGLACGDGIPEILCGEQCDDGNAVVGDGCTASCGLERIPGGGAAGTDCQVEWVVDNPPNDPLLDKHGAINGVQACTDGDPQCDFDAVPGTCTFHVRVCINNTNLESCRPEGRVRSWELRAPSTSKAANHPELAAVRAAFAGVPAQVLGPDHPNFCSETLAVPIGVNVNSTVPRPGSLVLKTLATLYSGARDSDKLKLICRP